MIKAMAYTRRGVEEIETKDLLPSSSFAMTIPLPARAEKRKPALKTVKMAKPFAFSSTLRGMTYRMTSNRQLAATRFE